MKKREGKKVKGSTHVRTIRRIPNCEPPQKKTSHKMSPASFRCHYCKRANVSRSLRGLKSHVSQTPECRARRDEEHAMLKQNGGVQIDSRDTSMPPVGHHAWEENMEGNNTLPSSNVDEHPSKRAQVDDDKGDDSDRDFRPTVSRTQTYLNKITQVCQEIRNMGLNKNIIAVRNPTAWASGT